MNTIETAHTAHSTQRRAWWLGVCAAMATTLFLAMGASAMGDGAQAEGASTVDATPAAQSAIDHTWGGCEEINTPYCAQPGIY